MDSPPQHKATLPKARRHGLAITSLVLGILGIVPCFILAGLPAIITGFMAKTRATQRPEEFGGRGMALAGIVLGLLSLITTVLFLVALNAAFRQGQRQVGEFSCVNNLRRVGIAMQIHAIDHGGAYPASLLELTNTLKRPELLHCPGDTNHVAATSWGTLTADNVSFELLIPSGLETESQTNAVVRCPIHRHTWHGNGKIRMGQGRVIAAP